MNKKPQNTKFVLKHLIRYLNRYKMLFAIVIGLTIISNLFSLIGPYFSGMAIDLIDVEKSEVVNIRLDKILFYVCLMISFYIIAFILSMIINYLMIIISQKIIYQMRKDLFNKLMSLSMRFYDDTKTGDIISRMSYDIDTINTTLSSDLVQIIASVFTVIGSFVMMIKISKILILVFVITIPLSIYLVRRKSLLVRPLFRKRSQKNGVMNAYIEEMISAHQTIKAYNKEEEIIKAFNEINNEASSVTYQAEYHGFIMGPTMNFVNNLSLSLISVIGTILYLLKKIKLGSISNFITYSKKFSGPINEIADMIAELQSSLAAGERVFKLLDELDEPLDALDAIELKSVKGMVKFSDVSFGYHPSKKVINHLNLSVKPGSLVAIVGPTGAGKTTLINLLMRFYDIDEGKILLDDIDIKDITRSSLRKAYAMVLQDTWVFNGTIFENVAYGKKDASLEEVITVCKAAHIHSYIEKLPLGYQTLLSDSGNNLSKGQKQLLTIARAMLLDANMLILDEATSNVDTMTEMAINDAMHNLMKNKTCFVIAHRLSTIYEADVILVVNDGEIVESGKHEELLAKKGFYAKLYNSQFS